MTENKVGRARYVMNVVGVVLYIVCSWVLLSVAIVAGGILNVLVYDRVFAWNSTITSAEQARWIWSVGLGFSLVCYAMGVFQAAGWLGLLPQLRRQVQQAPDVRRRRPLPPAEHELPKTRPSPEEIQRRGMPRG